MSYKDVYKVERWHGVGSHPFGVWMEATMSRAWFQKNVHKKVIFKLSLER